MQIRFAVEIRDAMHMKQRFQKRFSRPKNPGDRANAITLPNSSIKEGCSPHLTSFGVNSVSSHIYIIFPTPHLFLSLLILNLQILSLSLYPFAFYPFSSDTADPDACTLLVTLLSASSV